MVVTLRIVPLSTGGIDADFTSDNRTSTAHRPTSGSRDARRTGTQLALFAGIGVLSTLAYALIFLLARQVSPGQVANLVALGVTAIGNTAANRRITFGVTGSGVLRHHVQGLLVFGLGLALTSGSLWLLGGLAPTAGHGAEVVVLTVTNLVTTGGRFLAMRFWIFPDRTDPDPPQTAAQMGLPRCGSRGRALETDRSW